MLQRRARFAWRRRWVRVAVGLAVLAAVVVLDLRLIAPMLEPRIDGLPPDHQRVFAGEALEVTGLSTEKPLLALEDWQGVKVIADFPRARFEDGFESTLRAIGVPLPKEAFHELSYTTTATRLARAEQPPCRSRFTLTAAGGPETTTLILDQRVDSAAPGLLPLRLSSPTSDLIVEIEDAPATALEVLDLLDCGSLLIGGEEIPGAHRVRVEVAAGEPFDLFFRRLSGSETVALIDPDDGLRPERLKVRSAHDPEQEAMLRVVGDTRSLEILGLKIGRQQLELSYKGDGTARGVRAPKGTRPFERFRKGLLLSPLISLFLAMLHMALFQLLRGAFFGRSSI